MDWLLTTLHFVVNLALPKPSSAPSWYLSKASVKTTLFLSNLVLRTPSLHTSPSLTWTTNFMPFWTSMIRSASESSSEPTSWYNRTADQLRALKRERRRARGAGISPSLPFRKKYMKMQNAKSLNLLTTPKHPSILPRSKLASHLKDFSPPQMYSWTDQMLTCAL